MFETFSTRIGMECGPRRSLCYPRYRLALSVLSVFALGIRCIRAGGPPPFLPFFVPQGCCPSAWSLTQEIFPSRRWLPNDFAVLTCHASQWCWNEQAHDTRRGFVLRECRSFASSSTFVAVALRACTSTMRQLERNAYGIRQPPPPTTRGSPSPLNTHVATATLKI